jgi:16S rRNA processing protein RimM
VAGPADAPADLVALGAVRGAYGVKGWVRIRPFDAEASVLSQSAHWWLQDKGVVRRVEVSALKRHSDSLLAKWQGWDLPEAVDALRGATVCVPRAQFPPLPAGQYYWSDLIGLQVVNREGRALGAVQDVASNGAHELLQVSGADGMLLVPLVPAYVDDVDLATRVIRVDWQADWS